jgi:hypothetical protein
MHRNTHSQIVISGAAPGGICASLRSGLMCEDYPPMGYNTFRE